uniref:Uncharacterized protein n=1 Tax=Ditylenchus dipsaci TaxID=166011 RepID=A0A915DGH8_9BILA
MSSSSGKTDSESSMPFGGLFGGSNVCFKTCGMEDIQFAARRAGEMFLTMKICMVILTMITVICALLMTATVLYYMYSRNQKQKRDDEAAIAQVPVLIRLPHLHCIVDQLIEGPEEISK